jgi:hypothetical protein
MLGRVDTPNTLARGRLSDTASRNLCVCVCVCVCVRVCMEVSRLMYGSRLTRSSSPAPT